MLAVVFSMQGAGILAQSFVTMIALAGFRQAIERDPSHLDYVWRITLGMGTLPALVGLALRRNLPESPRHTLEIDNDYDRAYIDVDIVQDGKKRANKLARRVGESRASASEIAYSLFRDRQQLKLLAVVSVPRFALNVAFYGLTFNSNIILRSIGFGDTDSIYTNMFNSAVGSVIVALLGSIPGYM